MANGRPGDPCTGSHDLGISGADCAVGGNPSGTDNKKIRANGLSLRATRALILGISKNKNTRPGDSPDGCYVMLVAGTGFEPVTFRL